MHLTGGRRGRIHMRYPSLQSSDARSMNRTSLRPSDVPILSGDHSIHSGGNDWTAATKRDQFLRESVQRNTWDDTSDGVNKGLDPVTHRVFNRSMTQCVNGLQPLCYCSTACHNSLPSLKRQLQIDSLIDTWIDCFGQLPIRHGGLYISLTWQGVLFLKLDFT